MRFKSSFLLVLRHIFYVALVIFVLLIMLAILVLDMESTVAVIVVATVTATLATVYVLIKGRVAVEVTDEAVVIQFPLREAMTFSRRTNTFSSRIVVHSINYIPTHSERFLLVHDGESHQDVLLSNISKRSFDLLVAQLRRDVALRDAPVSAIQEAGFPVPKEGMLADYRRLIKFLLLGWLIFSGGGIAFLAYRIHSVSGGSVAYFVTMTGAFSVFMVVCVSIPVAMEYGKRMRTIPDQVALDPECLTIGDDKYMLDTVRSVTATPAEYTESDFSNARWLAVVTDWEKKKYFFGVRRKGGVWKTEFIGYGEMCESLEKAASTRGFEFLYDL